MSKKKVFLKEKKYLAMITFALNLLKINNDVVAIHFQTIFTWGEIKHIL